MHFNTLLRSECSRGFLLGITLTGLLAVAVYRMAFAIPAAFVGMP